MLAYRPNLQRISADGRAAETRNIILDSSLTMLYVPFLFPLGQREKCVSGIVGAAVAGGRWF
jgi:hypothetical protein